MYSVQCPSHYSTLGTKEHSGSLYQRGFTKKIRGNKLLWFDPERPVWDRKYKDAARKLGIMESPRAFVNMTILI